MMWARMRRTGRYPWIICMALAVILPAVWLLPVMQAPRMEALRAEEVRYVRVLDGNTGQSFTVRDKEQIRAILRCLPARQKPGRMPGRGFLLEFVFRGSRGIMRYALDASQSLPCGINRRYCEEYLRFLSYL